MALIQKSFESTFSLTPPRVFKLS